MCYNGCVMVISVIIKYYAILSLISFFSASKNPVTKSKKRTRKKIQVSPVKNNLSPYKNKCLGNPAKNMVVSVGSPQKLIDNFLKQEKAISDNPQVTL